MDPLNVVSHEVAVYKNVTASIYTRIAAFLDFIHRPVLWELENTEFRKLDLFPSSGERGNMPTLLGSLERANLNRWTS
jgi:hypothetical protein